MLSRVNAKILQYQDKELYLGLSGGIDSCVLMHLLVQTKQKFTVIHFNHNIQSNSNLCESYVKELCSLNDISCICVKLDCTLQQNESLEMAARRARLEKLDELLSNDAIYFTAHHLDDQVETFLYRIFRGTKLFGLHGLRTHSEFGYKIVRPLLTTAKSEIEEYANLHQIKFVQDESNFNSVHDRNYIRHNIIPVITKRWPIIYKSIHKLITNVHQHHETLNELIQPIEDKIVVDNKIFLTPMFNYSQNIQNLVITNWLRRNKIYLDHHQYNNLYKTVICAADKAKPYYRYKSLVIAKSCKKLHIVHENQFFLCHTNIKIALDQAPKELIDKFPDIEFLVKKYPNLYLQKGTLCKQSKAILQKFKVPYWNRGGLWMVRCHNKLLAIDSLWVKTT